MPRFKVLMTSTIEIPVIADSEEEAINEAKENIVKYEAMLSKKAEAVRVTMAINKTPRGLVNRVQDIINKMTKHLLDKGQELPGDEWCSQVQVELLISLADYTKDGGVSFEQAYDEIIEDGIGIVSQATMLSGLPIEVFEDFEDYTE